MKKRTFTFPVLLTLIILAITTESCRKDNLFNEDPDFKLSFSADTIMFDTVFTTVGSVTKIFKVFNPSNKVVNISSVELGGKLSSNYRFNIDGRAGVLIRDVEIQPKDSLWVFVEVTVDPNNSTTPLIVEDSLVFIVNGNRQKIMLAAFGQDAYFHYPSVPATSTFPAYSTISGIWLTDKPHVIYGLAIVPADEMLVMPAGTKVYMHHTANIAVADRGTLKIYGERDNEVIIRGSRLDKPYSEYDGGWGRIWLTAGSVNNEIDWAIIQNGRVGVHVDTLGLSAEPTLKISNTIIRNMSYAGLFAQGSWVEAYNCVFANCGEMAIWLNIGGKYKFRHCTIGNFWTRSNRQTPSVVINNYYRDVFGNYQLRDIEEASFGNCIIWGNKEDEIAFDDYPFGASVYNVELKNCLVRTSLNFSDEPLTFTNLIFNSNPLFENPDSMYLNINDNSPAIDYGSAIISSGILFDIEGNSRIQGVGPDLGAYEKR
jgi:hypothetical protein